MFFNFSFTAVITLMLAGVSSVLGSATNITARAAQALVPLSPIGNIAAAQTTSSDTRFYYQTAAGLTEAVISGAFDVGKFNIPGSGFLLVPANQILIGSPLAITTLNPNTNWQEIHVFFISPQNILSEYYYIGGWNGGPSCQQCVTASGFAVVPGSKVLYAMQNDSTKKIRVGFVSPGSPSTITEAIKTGINSVYGTWTLQS